MPNYHPILAHIRANNEIKFLNTQKNKQAVPDKSIRILAIEKLIEPSKCSKPMIHINRCI